MSTNPKESERISISVDRIQDMEFRVKFDKPIYQDLMLDEPPPAGNDRAANPTRLLAAAVGGCLSASLLFSALKLRLNIQGMHANVGVEHTRNEQGRLRIGKIDVEITPTIADPDPHKLQRCLDMFEDYCTVTQSVRKGIDVAVTVKS